MFRLQFSHLSHERNSGKTYDAHSYSECTTFMLRVVKVKTTFPLCLSNYVNITLTWCVEEWRYSPIILDVGIRWRGVARLRPRPPYPGIKPPVINLMGGWVNPRVGLDIVETREIPCSCRESIPSFSDVERKACLCTDRAIPALYSGW
jgi:hypothetical protein